MFKTFITSKIGQLMLGLLFSALLVGVQQLRVQHYQNAELMALVQVGELNTALETKETEAVSLTAAIELQNNKVKQLSLAAHADSRRRANDVLKIRVEHQEQLHLITTTENGPEAMNRWLLDYF